MMQLHSTPAIVPYIIYNSIHACSLYNIAHTVTGRGGECVRVPGAALQQPAGQAARLSQLRHHHPLLSGRSPLRSLRQVNFYTKFL